MTRIPGDFPNEGRAHAEDRRNTQSAPGQAVFHAYEIGDELFCPGCGNQVKVQEIGGGEVRCCEGPMDPI